MIVHAWRRREKGQTDAYVCVIDRRMACRLRQSSDIAIQPAVRLMEAFEVLKFPLWNERMESPHLHARKFRRLVHYPRLVQERERQLQLRQDNQCPDYGRYNGLCKTTHGC